MKVVAGAAAAIVAIWTVLFLFAPRAASGPEPIRYGQDTCDRCRMHFATPGYAGERLGRDGKLLKFDDVGCLLIDLWAAHAESTGLWVEDHAGGGFVPLLEAQLVRGDGLGTPMGYGVVAFRDRSAAEAFAAARHAELVSLEDLLRDKARFAPRPPSANTSPEVNR